MTRFCLKAQQTLAMKWLRVVLIKYALVMVLSLTSMFVAASEVEKAQAADVEPEAQAQNEDTQQSGAPKPEPVLEPIVVQVTGYAYYKAKEKEGSDPKRLLAIRASRLDAYRNMAERIYGISVSGQSHVRDFVLKNDSFSVNLDTVIRGAHVVSIAENKKTGIETVLELSLPGNFVECLNKVNSLKTDADCLQPLSSNGLSRSSADSVALRAPMKQQYYLK